MKCIYSETMPRKLDYERLAVQLRRHLCTRGPTGAVELCNHLRISQPVFSRLARAMDEALLVAGRARATRYAARRSIAGVGDRAPIYEVGCDDSPTRLLATLHAVEPDGFYVEPAGEETPQGFFGDLPFFLHDLRPAGFLGRLIPLRHPELEHPADVRFWSADHCLRYFVRHGWNLPGDLVVGDAAFRLYLANTQRPPDAVHTEARSERYLKLADDVLAEGAPGSSAAGEQAKFLVTKMPHMAHVLVKFSPPRGNPIADRLADLLVCEHLALRTLQRHGLRAADSELLQAGGRLFLEVKRFDRVGQHERRGVISFTALDAEWVGRMQSWTDTARHLVRQGRLREEALRETACLELFSKLIANTDMHHGNLSCICRGTTLVGLAPAYDVLPMLYAPVQGQLVERPFEPPIPSPADAPIWERVCAVAVELWERCAQHALVSERFQVIAGLNAKAVGAASAAGALLPRP